MHYAPEGTIATAWKCVPGSVLKLVCVQFGELMESVHTNALKVKSDFLIIRIGAKVFVG